MDNGTAEIRSGDGSGAGGRTLGQGILAHPRVVVWPLTEATQPLLPLVAVTAGPDGSDVVPVDTVAVAEGPTGPVGAVTLSRDARTPSSSAPPPAWGRAPESDPESQDQQREGEPWYCWLFPQLPGCSGG